MPTVSVLMPAYNAEKYIAEAIGSVLGQLFADWELVVVNDGSTDQTEAIVMGFRDERIRYFSNEENRGLTFTRNRLVDLAQGEYLAFLDSDDIAVPGRLAMQLAYLQKHPHVALLGGSLIGLEDDRRDTHSFMFDLSPQALPVHLLFYNPVSTSSVMLRRAALPEEHFRNGYPPVEDYDLWTRILRQRQGAILRDVLGYYRLHGQSISKQLAGASLANRNRVVLDQLAYYFPGAYSPEEAECHLGLADLNVAARQRDIPEVLGWVRKLRNVNRQQQKVDETVLDQVLYERVLKKFLRLDRYDLSVFRSLRALRSELKPRIPFELRKKELAILAFCLARRKFIATE